MNQKDTNIIIWTTVAAAVILAIIITLSIVLTKPPKYAQVIAFDANTSNYDAPWIPTAKTEKDAVNLCQADDKCSGLMFVTGEQQAVRSKQDPKLCSQAGPLPSFCQPRAYPFTVADKTQKVKIRKEPENVGPILFLDKGVKFEVQK